MIELAIFTRPGHLIFTPGCNSEYKRSITTTAGLGLFEPVEFPVVILAVGMDIEYRSGRGVVEAG
jgi:hypothetical protein